MLVALCTMNLLPKMVSSLHVFTFHVFTFFCISASVLLGDVSRLTRGFDFFFGQTWWFVPVVLVACQNHSMRDQFAEILTPFVAEAIKLGGSFREGHAKDDPTPLR